MFDSSKIKKIKNLKLECKPPYKAGRVNRGHWKNKFKILKMRLTWIGFPGIVTPHSFILISMDNTLVA